jgi:hypothetical protein
MAARAAASEAAVAPAAGPSFVSAEEAEEAASLRAAAVRASSLAEAVAGRGRRRK